MMSDVRGGRVNIYISICLKRTKENICLFLKKMIFALIFKRKMADDLPTSRMRAELIDIHWL